MIRTGIDRLIDDAADDEPGRAASARLRSSRVGYLTNDLAITADTRRARQALTASGVDVDRYFGPEHGLSGRAREGALVDDGVDPIDGRPVVSLYGDRVRPSAEALDGLDVVLIDLPDVGSRFYTYIWTISHMLQACADRGIAVMVADRPNPIGGDLTRAEGPMLDESCQSLVGRWAMPIRHGLTLGELARHWVRTQGLDVELEVVPATGWARNEIAMTRPSPWMPPSLNMPSAETAQLYPGTCLAEGVSLSEGRSTAVPFRVVGAPWLNGVALAEHLNGLELPGVRFLDYGFTPHVRDWAGEACEGVIAFVTDPAAIRPVHTGVRLLSAIARLHPGRLEQRTHESMPGESDATPLERLFGRRGAFDEIVAGEWDDPARLAVPHWADAVAPDLLYR